jgi:hypothetical protein
VGRLLSELRQARATSQVSTLLDRDPAAHVRLDHSPHRVTELLRELREAGAWVQAADLIERLPATGHFQLFRLEEDHRSRFRFGRETDGRPAEPWDWDDLDLWLVPGRGDREATLPSSYRRSTEFAG